MGSKNWKFVIISMYYTFFEKEPVNSELRMAFLNDF